MINYYIAKLFVRQCFVDIRINDVPVFRRSVDNDLSTRKPINYMIESSGRQSLTIHITPLIGSVAFNKEALCEVEIIRCDGGGVRLIPQENVCELSIKAGEGNLNSLVKKEMRFFNANVAYRIKRWGDCKELKKGKDLSRAVAAYFQNVAQLLVSKQYDKYANLVLARETNIINALYLDGKEITLRNQMLFDSLDRGFELCPLKGGKLIEYYAAGKVVTVLDRDMNSALRFQNKKTGELLVLDLLLGIKNNNELCIV